MKYKNIIYDDLSVSAQLGLFDPKDGATEIHVMLELTECGMNAQEQFGRMDEAIGRLINSPELKQTSLVLKRYFVSDAVNQQQWLTTTGKEAVSIVQQPPLNGSKVSLWLYFVSEISLSQVNGATGMQRSGYFHLFHTQLHERNGSAEVQTDKIFSRYVQSLDEKNCTLEANCIRTWIYVQDVDIQYKGMVKARREYFEQSGLTPQTHYIASTGIEGRYIHPECLVLMDAYAVKGLQKEQIRFLYAPEHLNPTYEYGVTFERGTAVDYGDRRHIFISGTASINNKGEIVHPQDVEKQTERMLENVKALLEEAGACIQDTAHLIIYLRDTADYSFVKGYFERYYPDIPNVIIWAPVCRPGWLIEMECIAIKEHVDESFRKF